MSISEFIFKSSIDNFAPTKSAVLESIDAGGRYSVMDSGQKISNTDWHLPVTHPKTYWEHLAPKVMAHNQLLIDHFGFHSAEVTDFWFQQYEIGDYHGFHNHPGCCFSSVLYVELGDTTPRTTFAWAGSNFEVAVNEGDIVSFPSFLCHTSKINQSARKTIISFNSKVAVSCGVNV